MELTPSVKEQLEKSLGEVPKELEVYLTLRIRGPSEEVSAALSKYTKDYDKDPNTPGARYIEVGVKGADVVKLLSEDCVENYEFASAEGVRTF